MNDLPAVTGTMECSNADFERRCLLLLKEEQEKLLPNNALIAVLCDGVRMAREYSEAIKGPISRVDQPLCDSFDQKAHHFFGDHGDHS